jgi:hypothetical protein
MHRLDNALTDVCAWLCEHPRWTCALICAANILTLRLFEVVR